MKKIFILGILFVFALFIGCDSDNDGNKIENDSEFNEAATGTIDNAKNLKTLNTSPEDQTALGKVFGSQGDLQTMLTKAQSQGTFPLSISIETASFALDPTCYQVDETAKKVTYNNCETGSGSINGTIQSTDNTVTVNLTMTLAYGTASGIVTMTGSVTVTDTQVSGSLVFTYKVTAVDYKITATYNNILIDSNGCPTGGSLSVNATYTVSGMTKSVNVTATFGPACGDVVGTY